jgi:hypothetical protein
VVLGNVVLLDMLSNVLVEVVVLGVTSVRQGIKGGMDCRSHAPDLVATKEQVMQCAVDLLSILHLVVALDVGPCGCLAPKGMKNRPDLLGVSLEGRVPRPLPFEFDQCLLIIIVCVNVINILGVLDDWVTSHHFLIVCPVGTVQFPTSRVVVWGPYGMANHL